MIDSAVHYWLGVLAGLSAYWRGHAEFKPIENCRHIVTMQAFAPGQPKDAHVWTASRAPANRSDSWRGKPRACRQGQKVRGEMLLITFAQHSIRYHTCAESEVDMPAPVQRHCLRQGRVVNIIACRSPVVRRYLVCFPHQPRALRGLVRENPASHPPRQPVAGQRGGDTRRCRWPACRSVSIICPDLVAAGGQAYPGPFFGART